MKTQKKCDAREI